SSTMSDKDWRYYIRATGKELQEFAKFLRSRALEEIEQKPSVAARCRRQPTTIEQSSQMEPVYAIGNTAMDYQPSRWGWAENPGLDAYTIVRVSQALRSSNWWHEPLGKLIVKACWSRRCM